MAARPRKRRRPAPWRRARRWLRRQGRLTRNLLITVGLLSAASLALFIPFLLREEAGRRAPESVLRTHRGPAPAPAPAPAPEPPATPARSRAGRQPRFDKTSAPAHPPGPRAAILIDDLGQNFAHLEQLARLQLPLSVAVIPGLPATARTVREVKRLGLELLLHQPMEPHDEGGKNPGEGVLLVSMSPEAVRAQLRRSLAAVPGAVGLNNHMGSRFTADSAALGPLMAELKAAGLFWLDSRTTAATRGLEAARAAAVPAIERDIFLDAKPDPDFVRGQLRKLVELARRRGMAVGIGHPHPGTIAVLGEMREELLGSGVTWVAVSALVEGLDPTPEGPALASTTLKNPGAAAQ